MRAGLRFQAVHWLPRGLADSNPRPANPSDVWANDGAYHDPPPGVVAKRGTTPLSGQKEPLGSKSTGCLPKRKTAVLWSVLALFPPSLVRAGTYPHGCIQISRFRKGFFFALSLI